jgi:hypothetical protein
MAVMMGVSTQLSAIQSGGISIDQQLDRLQDLRATVPQLDARRVER